MLDSGPSKTCRPPARTASTRRMGYAAGTIVLGALAGYVQILPVLRDSLQSCLRIGVAELGLLLSIGMMTGAVGVLVGGMLADRLRPRAIIQGCLVGAGVGMLMAGFGAHAAVMVAAVALIALFGQPLSIAIQSYLVNLFPHSPRRILSINMVALSGVGILYPLWAEYLLGLNRLHGVDFGRLLRMPFIILAFPMLVGALLYRPMRALRGPAKAPGDQRRWYDLRLGQGTGLLVVLLIVHMIADNTCFIWAPRVLGSGSFRVQAFAPGVVMAAYAVAYVVSRSLLAMLPDRVGTRWLLVVPGIAGGAVFTAGILMRCQASAATGLVFGAFLWSLEYPTILAMIARRDQEHFASALSIGTLGAGIGSFAVGSLLGWLGQNLGEARLWMLLLVPALGFPLVGIGGAWWLWRYRR